MERLLTEAEVARDWLNVEPTLLERYRHEGSGPPYVRVTPRVIRYAPSAVQRWSEFVVPRLSRSTVDGDLGIRGKLIIDG